MSRRARRPRAPVGGGGARHPRSLANLRNAPAAPAGNARACSHGGYGAIAAERLEAREREVLEALAADVPLRADDGGVPAADHAQVALLADVLCRLENVNSYLTAHGYLDDAGDVRPAADLAGRLRREAADYLDALGMSPRSRAKLGVDVSRAASAHAQFEQLLAEKSGGGS